MICLLGYIIFILTLHHIYVCILGCFYDLFIYWLIDWFFVECLFAVIIIIYFFFFKIFFPFEITHGKERIVLMEKNNLKKRVKKKKKKKTKKKKKKMNHS